MLKKFHTKQDTGKTSPTAQPTETCFRLQSRTKLLEKVFSIMSTFLRNKTISKTTPLQKENPFPQFNVASHKRPGIRLSFEYTTTLLSGEGGEGRTGTATMFRKMLSKYTIFSTVLSKIVDTVKLGRLPFTRVNGKFWLVAYGSFGYIIVKWLFMPFPSEWFV